MKIHGLPVPNVKGSNTVRNMAIMDPKVNLKGQPQHHSLWRTSTRFCPVPSERGLCPRALSFRHQTGNKGFSWLWHSAPGKGF